MSPEGTRVGLSFLEELYKGPCFSEGAKAGLCLLKELTRDFVFLEELTKDFISRRSYGGNPVGGVHCCSQ